jgi:hypothetical protein
LAHLQLNDEQMVAIVRSIRIAREAVTALAANSAGAPH